MRKQQQQTNSNGERADVVRAALVNFFSFDFLHPDLIGVDSR